MAAMVGSLPYKLLVQIAGGETLIGEGMLDMNTSVLSGKAGVSIHVDIAAALRELAYELERTGVSTPDL